MQYFRRLNSTLANKVKNRNLRGEAKFYCKMVKVCDGGAKLYFTAYFEGQSNYFGN